MGKVKFIMDKVLEAGALLSFLAMIAVVSIQVFARFALPRAPHWTEEAARIFFIYTISFGAGLAVKANAFVYVDTFINLLPTKIQIFLKMLIHLVISIFMGIIAFHSTTYINVGAIQSSPSLRIPMSYVFASTFIVAFFIGVYSLIELGKILNTLRGGKK
jgi:TRAP-type C4-dicarboxylate transport system permease small subunit